MLRDWDLRRFQTPQPGRAPLGWDSLTPLGRHRWRSTIRISCRPADWFPVLALAESAGLRELADDHLSVPADKGADVGLKVASLVGGMVADSIGDMALL